MLCLVMQCKTLPTPIDSYNQMTSTCAKELIKGSWPNLLVLNLMCVGCLCC
jgi:hypothetical protein